MSKLERLRQIIGRTIIDVEYIESGVSNYYAFTLDDIYLVESFGRSTDYTHVFQCEDYDIKKPKVIFPKRTKTIICAEGKENEEP